MAGNHAWTIAGIVIAFLTLGSGAVLIKTLGRSWRSPSEWVGWMAVTAVAFWVIRNYFYDGLIGAGDSYHYTLQIADFVTQLRRGIFPVLVGQSEYAFNGNVHTVRTAPYFTHFAGLLDCLTARQLSFYLLKNLTVILSAWGGAFAAYASARVMAPNRKFEAVLIAALFISAPGILTPLMSMDMYATFMTVPFLPCFFLGLTLSLQRVADSRPMLLSVGSLALIWYAHPPIGAWLSPLLLLVQGLRILLVGAAPKNLLRPIMGAALFLLLTSYLFYSVYSLHFPSTAERAVATRAGIAANLAASSPAVFLPVGDTAERQLQLGYALWGCLALCVAGLFKPRLDRIFLGFAVVVGLVLVLPVPALTGWLWSIVPAAVINITNNWPGQRFYPILSAAIAVWTAVTLLAESSGMRRTRWFVLALLTVACLSSLDQNRPLLARGKTMKVPRDLSTGWLDPENVTLTRSSYLLFDGRPDYYSDSWVDPEFESRLLDAELNPVESDTAALLAKYPVASGEFSELVPMITKTFELDRTKNWLLDFKFTSEKAVGEIAITGAVRRIYPLPVSGEKFAFGSGALATHSINLSARPGSSPTVKVESTVSGSSVRALSYATSELPVALKSLTPYRVHLHASSPGFLETPTVWIPGYEAKVNGRPQSLRRSFQGLVTVPISGGESDVELSYPGPTGLSASWYLALLGFMSWPLLWRQTRNQNPPQPLDRAAIRRYHLINRVRRISLRSYLFGFLVVLVAGAAIGIVQTRRRAAARVEAFGSIRIALRLPQWSAPFAEPLLVSGRAGAADCVYLSYVDPTHVRIGYDHWSKGGPISEPLLISRSTINNIEITSPALYPKNHPKSSELSNRGQTGEKIPLLVQLNQKPVLQGEISPYPYAPDELVIGKNSIGFSSCRAFFSGEILEAVRFVPDFLKPPTSETPP